MPYEEETAKKWAAGSCRFDVQPCCSLLFVFCVIAVASWSLARCMIDLYIDDVSLLILYILSAPYSKCKRTQGRCRRFGFKYLNLLMLYSNCLSLIVQKGASSMAMDNAHETIQLTRHWFQLAPLHWVFLLRDQLAQTTQALGMVWQLLGRQWSFFWSCCDWSLNTNQWFLSMRTCLDFPVKWLRKHWEHCTIWMNVYYLLIAFQLNVEGSTPLAGWRQRFRY